MSSPETLSLLSEEELRQGRDFNELQKLMRTAPNFAREWLKSLSEEKQGQFVQWVNRDLAAIESLKSTAEKEAQKSIKNIAERDVYSN